MFIVSMYNPLAMGTALQYNSRKAGAAAATKTKSNAIIMEHISYASFCILLVATFWKFLSHSGKKRKKNGWLHQQQQQQQQQWQ